MFTSNMRINPLTRLRHLKDDSINYMLYVNKQTAIKTKLGRITKEDFDRLKPAGWLCDKIVWSYIEILNLHFTDFLIIKPQIASFLCPDNDCDVMEWAKHKAVLFPICVDLHWVLVEFTFSKIVIYDSLLQQSMLEDQQIKNIQAYIEKHFNLTCVIILSPLVTEKFRQPNLDDCGVYMLMFAKGIVSETCFYEGNMDIYRNRLVHELLTQRLIYNNE